MVTQTANHRMKFLCTRFVKFLVLAFLVVLPKTGAQDDNVSVLSRRSWYNAALSCTRQGQKLYNSANLSTVKQFLNVSSGKYWVGVKMMYSPWRWTDKSTLFTYLGYRQLTDEDEEETSNLFENEAVMCYSECWTKYIGLQGTKCFCLKSGTNTTVNYTEDRCWGNSYDHCGTSQGISVYKNEFSQNLYFGDDDLCGYATFKEDGKHFTSELNTENNCNDNKKRRICECDCTNKGKWCTASSYCIQYNKTDWFTANRSCRLLNYKELKSYPVHPYISDRTWTEYEYWIGLSRYQYIGWTNRHEVIPGYDHNGCVWVKRLGNGTLVYGFSDCSEQYKSVCIKGGEISTTVTTAIDTNSVTETDSQTQTEFVSTTASTSTLMPTAAIDTNSVTETDSQTQKDAAVVGGSIGAIVGVVVLVLLLVIIWMKRTKRHCFREKSANRETPHMSSVQNVYEMYNETHTQSDYCTINPLAIQNVISDN